MARMQSRSAESVNSLERLKGHIENLLTLGDNSEVEKEAARLVIEALNASIELAEALGKLVGEVRMEHDDDADRIEEVERLGHMLVSRMANFAQSIKADTLPFLAAVSPEIQAVFLARLLEHGKPTLTEVLASHPEYATGLAQMIFGAVDEEQRLDLMKALAQAVADSENSEPTPNVGIEPVEE